MGRGHEDRSCWLGLMFHWGVEDVPWWGDGWLMRLDAYLNALSLMMVFWGGYGDCC